MANSGSCRTTWRNNQAIQFNWAATISTSQRKATIRWGLTTACSDGRASPTYYLVDGTQSLVLTNKGKQYTLMSMPPYRWSGGRYIYNSFVDSGCWLDQKYNFEDFNGDYIGIHRWIRILGTNWASGSFTIDFDDLGNASFKIDGSFGWMYGGYRERFSVTWNLNNIGRKQYPITFNNNIKQYEVIGVKGIPSSVNKSHGLTLKLPTTKPTSASHNFKGWSLTPTGNVSYYAGGNFARNTPTTLYAVWEAKKFTYEINMNKGRVDKEDLSSTNIPYVIDNTSKKIYPVENNTFEIPFGSIITFPNDIYRNGYTFKGWELDNNIYTSTKTYTPTFKVTDPRDKKINATWEANKYTISFYDSETKEQIKKPIIVTYDDYIIGDFTYEKQGYELEGWSEEIQTPYTLLEDIPKDKIYVPAENFTKPSNILYQIDRDIKLYTVLRYKTTFYIYTEGKWRLALPYVWTENKWRITLGYGQNEGRWKL